MSAPILRVWDRDRDRDDAEALRTDSYLDALLAAAECHADGVPTDADLDPGVRDAARVVVRSLVRVHPSFRFEERLASRLAGLAAAQACLPAQPGTAARAGDPGGTLLAFPSVAASRASFAAADADPVLDAILRGELDPADDDAAAHVGRLSGTRRPLIVGGAIMSAAISLAGVAWVAWRAARPAGSTITRAARIRRATAVLPTGGLGGPA